MSLPFGRCVRPILAALMALALGYAAPVYAEPSPGGTADQRASAVLDQFAKSIAAFGGSDNVMPLNDYALGQVWVICYAGKANAEGLARTAAEGYRKALATMVGECARLGAKQGVNGLSAKDLTDTAATVIHAEYGAFMQTYRAPLLASKPKEVAQHAQARQAVVSMASWSLGEKK